MPSPGCSGSPSFPSETGPPRCAISVDDAMLATKAVVEFSGRAGKLDPRAPLQLLALAGWLAFQ
jgi:hypothetical protein